MHDFALQFFLSGLRAEIAKKVSVLQPETFERAIQMAIVIEEDVKPIKTEVLQVMDIDEMDIKNQQDNTVESRKSDEMRDAVHNLSKQMKQFEFALNAIRETKTYDSNRATYPNSAATSGIKCFHCNRLGHRYRKCFQATQADIDRIEERQNQLYKNRNRSNEGRLNQD